MSEVTLHAVHEAIAAYIADVSEGEILFLIDWQLPATAALSEHPDRTMYFNIGTDSPYHHRLGLLH